MPPSYFPLRWESTGDQWWFASPIDWAAANGLYDLVSELLHLDTNLLIKLTSLRRIHRLETVWDDEEQFDDVAKCRSQVARRLLHECETKKGHNSLIRAGYGGWFLYTAASAGDADFVKELLERDPLLVFGEGEYGVTDLFYAAARSKKPEVFRLLLDSSVSPACFQSKGGEDTSVFKWEMMNRAVHATARGGNLEVLRELLGDSSDVLVYKDVQGSTLLHTASARGQVEVVKHLVASYDIISCSDNQGNMALHVAAYRGYLPVVELLLHQRPSLASSSNHYGDTFLHMAVSGFRSPGFRRLDRQIELMEKLVRGKLLNTVVNTRNNEGRTALHFAALDNIQSSVVELLMTVPTVKLNVHDCDGMTPLDLLRQRPRSVGSEILIKKLVSAGGVSGSSSRDIGSQMKMTRGIGSSPGTCFEVPDAEIYLYMEIDDGKSDSDDDDIRSIESCSVDSPGDKKASSINYASKRLKNLLRWSRGNKDCDSSSEMSTAYTDSGNRQVPLRQRYSKSSQKSSNLPPSPSTKRNYAFGLMHGVINATQHLAVASSRAHSSPLSRSATSSPSSAQKQKKIKGRVGLSNSESSLNKKVMNEYFCFGAQGLAVEESISTYPRPVQSFKTVTSLRA